MIFARLLLEPKSSIFEDAADKKLFSPRKGGEWPFLQELDEKALNERETP